jgi:hypothetical protein
MAMNEWRELLRVVNASVHEREPDASLLALLMQSFGGGEGLDTSLLPRVPTPAASRGVVEADAHSRAQSKDFVAQVLRPATPAAGARGVESFVFRRPVEPVPNAGSNTSGSLAQAEGTDSSPATTVVKTVGLATGVGPIVAGLMKLFGGGPDSGEGVPPALPFSLPEQISVEAGLAQDRSFVPVSYSQRGVARAAMTARNDVPVAAQISVNVQAMDSRSFLDHSDEIARAVRDAMLRSHSLNDVVAEI